MEYTKSELLQCIYDTAIDDLPLGWKSVSISFKCTEGNKEASYIYIADDGSSHTYTPSNFIAPMNAASFLLESHYRDLNHNDAIGITIDAEGQMKIELL